MSSTICALATPPGAGGIAVVRVSGPEAYAVVGEIFTPRNPAKRVAEAKGYTAMLGHYHLRGEEMDETIALFFRAPHSYTGEDVIELSVHGGNAMAQGLLEALYLAGAAPAGPGAAGVPAAPSLPPTAKAAGKKKSPGHSGQGTDNFA